jgi:hypothetical protein
MSAAPPELPPLPSFIIIGAQKCATRWLRSNLGEHPQIWAVENELSYFDADRRYALGPDFYRSQFAGWWGEPILGESTPGYLMARNDPVEVARRIGETVPDVRLLAVIRNPVDRAQSALIHHIRYGRLRPSTDLVDYVRSHPDESDPLGVVAGGRYAAGLEAFRSRFGDQLLVLLHDDIGTDPGGVFDTAAHHVGAEAGFVPSGLVEVRFSNRSTTGEAVAGETPLSPEARAELYAYFRDDLDRLEQLLEVDLSAWVPDAQPVS